MRGLYIYYEIRTLGTTKKANKELDMQTNQCTNKQLVPVCKNQTNESSPTEQIVTLTEPAPYQHYAPFPENFSIFDLKRRVLVHPGCYFWQLINFN